MSRREADESPDLGPCCACGRRGRSVRNVLMLGVKAPEAGKGWGCVQCGLPADGAVAVVCDRCLRDRVKPREAVAGYPGEGRRVPVSSLSGTHQHRIEFHPEVAEEDEHDRR